MKKLIGVSLIALFAIVTDNSANAQVDSLNGYTTIVKQKRNGERKEKHIPNVVPAPVIIYTTDGYGIYSEALYYGYRTHKYYDEQGVKHKVLIYDETVPVYHVPYYYYYR